MEQTLNNIIQSKDYHDVLSIVKGFRNGAVYGAKIRFPHALVMTLLFRRSDPKTMMKFILKVTFQHSRNLAFFVTIYKTLMLIQRRIQGSEKSEHSFIAGIIGGYVIFGTDNAVNQQIVLYLFSRISTGLARLAVKKGYVSSPDYSFSVFAAVTWGIVMWLFRYHPDTLHGGLQTSMVYLYQDSNVFSDIRTLLWHNK